MDVDESGIGGDGPIGWMLMGGVDRGRHGAERGDDRDDDGAGQSLDRGVAAQLPQRVAARGDAGLLQEPRRQLQAVDGGNRHHRQEQRDLDQEQPAVIGVQQRRHAAGEIIGVDDSGRQERADADDAEDGKSRRRRARHCERRVVRTGGAAKSTMSGTSAPTQAAAAMRCSTSAAGWRIASPPNPPAA